jgi:hypothetical protein
LFCIHIPLKVIAGITIGMMSNQFALCFAMLHNMDAPTKNGINNEIGLVSKHSESNTPMNKLRVIVG